VQKQLIAEERFAAALEPLLHGINAVLKGCQDFCMPDRGSDTLDLAASSRWCTSVQAARSITHARHHRAGRYLLRNPC
jgi:hypothetical protein